MNQQNNKQKELSKIGDIPGMTPETMQQLANDAADLEVSYEVFKMNIEKLKLLHTFGQ